MNKSEFKFYVFLIFFIFDFIFYNIINNNVYLTNIIRDSLLVNSGCMIILFLQAFIDPYIENKHKINGG